MGKIQVSYEIQRELTGVLERPPSYQIEKVANQDYLWKKVIADLFTDFLLFFLPDFHMEVDFSKPVEFLQQELFKEIMDERKGLRRTDQLVKVQLKNGEEKWVLVHIEVQTQDEKGFAKRVFEYFYRIYDRYEQKIVAIALFTNTSKKSTNTYNYLYFGTELSYTFNKYVLADFDESELQTSSKLFSKALLVAMYLNKTKNNVSQRTLLKEQLLKEITRIQGIDATEMEALFYFTDYLLTLPKEFTQKINQEILQFIRKEDVRMESIRRDDLSPTLAYVYEKIYEDGLEKGVSQGIERGIEQGIEQKTYQVVINLIKNGFEDEVIANLAEISIEQVQEIRANY
ncbi:Rpn family recombination-promoting nuclease/putative transposase, partial [Providencia sp. NPDC089923]|uniref:Rpn family recombination-promoting nuclease/putative transposase n=1 Tax=Providencia sp. NPDC089923 TaxID=3415004 RepID=UPI003C2BECFB